MDKIKKELEIEMDLNIGYDYDYDWSIGVEDFIVMLYDYDGEDIEITADLVDVNVCMEEHGMDHDGICIELINGVI